VKVQIKNEGNEETKEAFQFAAWIAADAKTGCFMQVNLKKYKRGLT
jgi:hypothetical protein